MSNGKPVLIDLNNVSLTLLNRTRKRGRPAMLNLSGFVREMIQMDSMGCTKYISLRYPFPIQSGSKVERLEKKRLKVFESFSSLDLVEMDKQGIKILDVFTDYDMFDRSWAE